MNDLTIGEEYTVTNYSGSIAHDMVGSVVRIVRAGPERSVTLGQEYRCKIVRGQRGYYTGDLVWLFAKELGPRCMFGHEHGT